MADGGFPLENKDLVDNHYVIGNQIGSGAFSVVHEAKHKVDQKTYAIKIINKKGTTYEQMYDEISVMAKIYHPNIVNFKEIFDSPENYYVVMEMVNGGELFDRIIELTKYSEAEAATVMRQALLAIQHMHHLNLVHRDLKPENLLLSSKESNATIKVADFGFTCHCESSELHAILGTPPYMAPEIVSLRYDNISHSGYGKPVDIWAMGVILYILLSGIHPFQMEDEELMLENIENGQWNWLGNNWDKVSAEAKDLITGMLNLSSKDRLNITQCLSHPWFNGKAKETDLNEVKLEIKQYQAKKKFKGAIFGVMATQKMRGLLANIKKDNK